VLVIVNDEIMKVFGVDFLRPRSSEYSREATRPWLGTSPLISLTKQVLGRNFIPKVEDVVGSFGMSMVTNYLARTLYLQVF
jgi:hypothetical protein